MKIVPLAEVKDRLSAYIDESRDSPVIVTRNGRPVAMIIPIDDDEDIESLLLAHHPRFRQLLEDARERVRRDGGMSLSELRHRVETADR